MAECYADVPEDALNSTWTDADLARLALHIVCWEDLAAFWGLTEAEEEAIKRDNRTYAAQKVAALRRWKAKCPDAATYRQLIRVFGKVGKMDLVEKVREIILNPEDVPVGGPEDVLSSYRKFLEKTYNQLPHPSMLADQWPILNSPTYVPLSLSKQAKEQHTSMEHFPTHSTSFLPFMWNARHHKTNQPVSEEQEVHLSQLFRGGIKKGIVIKGFPGSGKTTLTWHANQQWAKRELFQQFSLFLSIPLRSTRVQQATCLADLIHHPDQQQRKAIAQAISACNGEGVCFWFDGWDEMPQEVQKESFVASFIRRGTPGASLPECVTVVTTRPEALFLSNNSQVEFWMNGLSVDQVSEIITKSVEGTDHSPSELMTCLQKNSSLQAFCLVPLNVAIMVSLFFLFQSSLPNTQTELFKCLVLSLLLRNLQMRWKLGITSLKSFEALPDLPSQSFRSICRIAFQGIMSAKTVFYKSDVPDIQQHVTIPLSTLGLMKISPRMEWYGVEEELAFLHATLQEFLAAVHLSVLDNQEQVRIVSGILESKSWHQKSVLQFYAGLTRLSSSEVRTTIFQRHCITNPMVARLGLMAEYGDDREGGVSLSSLMTFINCLFEAQLGHLCRKLTHSDSLCLRFNFTYRFNTADLSNLGYFLGWFCQKKTCELTLNTTSFSPQIIKVFVNQVKEIWNSKRQYHRPSLSLLLSDGFPRGTTSEVQNGRLQALCGLTKDTNLISKFNLHLLIPPDESGLLEHYRAVMKILVEALTRNSSCADLVLNCDVIPVLEPLSTKLMLAAYSEYYAVLLITLCKHIRRIAFYYFFEIHHYAYPLFASALRCNTTLQDLDLSQNVMFEEVYANIAKSLSYNETIKFVYFGSWITAEELETFLCNYGLQLPVAGLEIVYVSERAIPTELGCKIMKMINLQRMLSGNTLFKVARCIDDDDYGEYYVVYNGFEKLIVDKHSS